jgi:hypothetical protein
MMDLKGIWKEKGCNLIEFMSRNLPGETEEEHESSITDVPTKI